MATKNLILITGATGQQGGAIARELLAKGYPVRALTRRPEHENARALAALGAEIATGNLDDAGSLERALKGAWGVFAVQNTWEAGVEQEEVQGKLIAELARKAGVQHIVYSSVGSAHRGTGVPHFENKWRVEQTIRALGFPSYTILRPVFFMENLASPWFLPAIQQGTLSVALKAETPLQMIAVKDIGRYGLLAFEQHERFNGRAIDIAGDEVTMPETAAILTKAMGQSVKFVPADIEGVRQYSTDYASMLEWFDAVGYDVHIRSTSLETGIRPTTLAEWAASVKWPAATPAS